MGLLGRADDPRFWTEEVAKKDYFKKYRDEAKGYWDKNDLEHIEFKALKYSDYKLYWETGDRSVFQAEYFSRRSAIEHTVPLALMYPDEDIYIKRIMDWVFTICDEYSWCLPAHQGELGPNDNSRVDLFAAETGLHLAMIYTLLGDRLDTLIKNRIIYEVKRRVVDTYLGVENYGWWENGTSNWTAVCTGGVAGAMMLLYPELVDSAVIERFNRSIDKYLSGFKDDGICLEGSGYWAYGVGFFVLYADMIRTFTEGRVDYFKLPKIKAIATFPQKMFLTGSASVSFADSGRTLRYNIGVIHRLKTEFPTEVLAYDLKYGGYGEGCGRLCYRIFGAAWTREEYVLNPAESDVCFESYAADSQWLVKRTEKYGFAAKAGNNAELHNHNDVGSFIFAKGGEQLLVDLGSGKYTRQYFSSERYNIIECASFGHSVPIIDGVFQSVGADMRAVDVKYERGSLSFDMAGAYKAEGLKSLVRSFTLEDDGIILHDSFDCSDSSEIVERIAVIKEPSIEEGRICVGAATVEYDPSSCQVSVSQQTCDSTPSKKVYLIDFKLVPAVKTFECRIY